MSEYYLLEVSCAIMKALVNKASIEGCSTVEAGD